MKLKSILSLGLISIALSGCYDQSRQFKRQINNFIVYKGYNCYPSSSSYNKLIGINDNKLVLYKYGKYYINPIYESDIYIGNYNVNNSQDSNDMQSSDLFCKKYNLEIKSIEDVNNGENKIVYFTIKIPEFPYSMLSSRDYTAIFGLFDGTFKLKVFNDSGLSIDETLDVYNKNYQYSANKNNISQSIYNQLINLSSRCVPSVAPITAVSFFLAINKGDVSSFVNNQSLCQQLSVDGKNLTTEYLKIKQSESDPQLALQKAIKKYGDEHIFPNLVESVIYFSNKINNE